MNSTRFRHGFVYLLIAIAIVVIVATLINGGLTSISPDGKKVVHTPCPDVLTTNAAFGGPNLSVLYATLSTTGKLIAFDSWPTKGLKLNFQA